MGGSRMQRGRVSGARELAVQAARRQSRLHRWEMQRLYTRRGAAILQPISQRCSKDYTQVLCTRARRVKIARRGDARINLSRELACQRRRTHPSRDQSPLFWCLYCYETKMLRVPKEAYLKSHPRNTLSSSQRHRALFFAAEQTQRPPGNELCVHAVSAAAEDDAGSAARSHRHNTSEGAAGHSAPNKEATSHAAAAPKRTK